VDMQQINAEYEALFAKLKDVHQNKDGEFYKAREATTETAAEFIDIIEKLINMDGVQIEICGSWLWLTGNTKEYRDDLKKLSFRWSSNKGAWYFHRDGYKKRSRRSLTLDEIRGFYGSEIVEAQDGKKKISA